MEFLQFIEQKKTLGFHQFFVFCPLHFNSLKISTFQTFRLLLFFFKIIIFINNLIIVECFFMAGFVSSCLSFSSQHSCSCSLSFCSLPSISIPITSSLITHFQWVAWKSHFLEGNHVLLHISIVLCRREASCLCGRTPLDISSQDRIFIIFCCLLAFSYLPNTFLFASSSAIGLVGFTS